MTPEEIELEILKKYVAQYKTATSVGATDKCARELDFREVFHEVTGLEGADLDFESMRWFQRLVTPKPVDATLPLRPCSDGNRNRTAHVRHARAYVLPGRTPTWDRIEELERQVAEARPPIPARQLEEKFKILWSVNQEAVDFNEWTNRGRSHDVPVGILFVDIDEFGEMNLRFLETKVDATLLPDVQRLLERSTRFRGGAYRHGGEEFVVLLPNHTIEETQSFAERLRQMVESYPFEVDGVAVSLTVSIGVASFADHGEDFKAVLEAANAAKKRAKLEGRNRVIVTSATD